MISEKIDVTEISKDAITSVELVERIVGKDGAFCYVNKNGVLCKNNSGETGLVGMFDISDTLEEFIKKRKLVLSEMDRKRYNNLKDVFMKYNCKNLYFAEKDFEYKEEWNLLGFMDSYVGKSQDKVIGYMYSKDLDEYFLYDNQHNFIASLNEYDTQNKFLLMIPTYNQSGHNEESSSDIIGYVIMTRRSDGRLTKERPCVTVFYSDVKGPNGLISYLPFAVDYVINNTFVLATDWERGKASYITTKQEKIR